MSRSSNSHCSGPDAPGGVALAYPCPSSRDSQWFEASPPSWPNPMNNEAKGALRVQAPWRALTLPPYLSPLPPAPLRQVTLPGGAAGKGCGTQTPPAAAPAPFCSKAVAAGLHFPAGFMEKGEGGRKAFPPFFLPHHIPPQ